MYGSATTATTRPPAASASRGTQQRGERARYAFGQIRWLLYQGLILIAAMGVGVRWVWMLLRTIAFGLILLNGFLRMIWYYLRSPYIVRRVRYSSVPVPASHVKMRSFIKKRHAAHHAAANTATTSAGGDGLAAEASTASGKPAAGTSSDCETPTSTRSLRRRRFEGSTTRRPAPAVAEAAARGESTLSTPTSTSDESDDLNDDGDDEKPFVVTGDSASAAAGSFRGPTPVARGGGSDEDSDDEAEGSTAAAAAGLNNRAYLDVHYPIPVHELMRSSIPSDTYDVKARTHAARNVGLRHAKGINVPPTRNAATSSLRFPVIICVTGGAWIIGVHFWMAMMARVLSACGFIVVTPDYRNFPAALIPHMVDDVDAAIAWTVNNIQDMHGDPSRIYLLGQSAGAHLTMMSMLRQVERLHDPDNAPPVASTYNPRRDIRAWIGLSGMYDLSGMADFLHSRGLYKSVLRRMCAGDVASCSALVQLHKTDAAALAYNLPLTVLFAHGNCDSSAPFSESAHMAAVLRGKLAEHIAGTSSTASREQTPLKSAGYARPQGLPESPFERPHHQFRGATYAPVRNNSMLDGLGLEMPFVRLHTLAGATHTTPMVEDFLAGRSEIAAILLSLAHSHAAADAAEGADAPSGLGKDLKTSMQARLARTEIAAQAANRAATELATLDASFTNAGSVTFSAQAIAAVMEAVVNEGTPQAFLRGGGGLEATPIAGPLARYHGTTHYGGEEERHHALTMAHVKFRPLVFRWQANLASFVSAF